MAKEYQKATVKNSTNAGVRQQSASARNSQGDSSIVGGITDVFQVYLHNTKRMFKDIALLLSKYNTSAKVVFWLNIVLFIVVLLLLTQ